MASTIIQRPEHRQSWHLKVNYIYNEEAEILSISLLCMGTEGTSPRVLIAMSFLLCINLARVSANDSISGA